VLPRGCWADGRSASRHAHEIAEYDALPKPVQKKPGPPILIGGGGPKVFKARGARGRDRRINPHMRGRMVTAEAAASASGAETLKKPIGFREGAGALDDIELQIRPLVCRDHDESALGLLRDPRSRPLRRDTEEVLGFRRRVARNDPEMITSGCPQRAVGCQTS